VKVIVLLAILPTLFVRHWLVNFYHISYKRG